MNPRYRRQQRLRSRRHRKAAPKPMPPPKPGNPHRTDADRIPRQLRAGTGDCEPGWAAPATRQLTTVHTVGGLL